MTQIQEAKEFWKNESNNEDNAVIANDVLNHIAKIETLEAEYASMYPLPKMLTEEGWEREHMRIQTLKNNHQYMKVNNDIEKAEKMEQQNIYANNMKHTDAIVSAYIEFNRFERESYRKLV